MAKNQRSTTVKNQSLDELISTAQSLEALIAAARPTGEVEIGEHNTLTEVFEHDPEDDKSYLLLAAASIMWDAIKTAYLEGHSLRIESPMDIVPIALHHFISEHSSEFIGHPERFRIPTEAEDEESKRIAIGISSLDPQPSTNPYSPYFRPDLLPGGGEILEGDGKR